MIHEHPSKFRLRVQKMRANRQFLVAYTAVKEVEQYFDRKLLVHLHQPVPESITISKEKASHFLKWLEHR